MVGRRRGEHRFSGTGRADHDDVVAAAGSHFQRTLGVNLTPDVAEIDTVAQRLAEDPVDIDLQRRYVPVTLEKVQRLHQVAHRMHVDSARDGCLAGVFAWENHALVTGLAGLHGHRQNAPDGPHGSVECQLAEDDVLRKDLGRDVSGSGQDAHGNGQVKGRSFLSDIGGREIDGNAAVRKDPAGVLYCGGYTIPAFLDGVVRQTDHRECGKLIIQIGLDTHDIGVDSEGGATQHSGHHTGLLGAGQIRD